MSDTINLMGAWDEWSIQCSIKLGGNERDVSSLIKEDMGGLADSLRSHISHSSTYFRFPESRENWLDSKLADPCATLAEDVGILAGTVWMRV